MKYKKIGIAVFILVAAVALISLSISTCKSRKIRAEAIRFLKIVTETTPAVTAVLAQIDQMDPQEPELEGILTDSIQQINTILATVKALKLETGEVIKVRDLYVSALESLRDALALILVASSSMDPKVLTRTAEQLQVKLNIYDRSSMAFEKSSEELRGKYGIEGYDLGVPTPVTPVTPMPFTPSEQPAPFQP